MKTDWGKDDARRIYARARPLYHARSTTTLDPILGRIVEAWRQDSASAKSGTAAD
jgi:hypothetical protein